MSAHAFHLAGSHAVTAPRKSFAELLAGKKAQDEGDHFSRRMSAQWERAQELGLDKRPYSEPRKIQRRPR